MRTNFIIHILILANFVVCAQEGIPSYGTKNADQAKIIIPSSFASLVLGETIKEDKKRILLYSIDANGNIIWSKTLSAKDPLVINDALKTKNGYVLAGENYVNNREALLLIDTDSTGNPNWVANFNEDGNEIEPYAIESTPSAYYIGGFTKLATLSVNSFYNFSIENQYPYLLKTSKEGKKIWSKQIALNEQTIVGDIRDIAYTKDNQLVFIANIYNPKSKSKTLTNFLVKINEEGTVVWSKSIENKRMEWLKLKVDANNHIFVVGKQTISDKNTDISVMKLDANGVIIWSKLYGTESVEKPFDFTVWNNNLVLSLTSNHFDSKKRSQSLVVKLNKDGEIIANHYIKEKDYSKIASVQVLNNQIYYTGAVIDFSNRVIMNTITGILPLSRFSSAYLLKEKENIVTIKDTPIQLIDVKSEVSPNHIIKDYKITIENEEIIYKKL